MTAEFYADQYKRYATYARNYGNNHLYKIAGGPSSNDYHWTETLMKNIPGGLMNGLSLHHYTITHNWSIKGSATKFTEEEYFTTIKNTLVMDDLVTRHSSIMDQYDPQKQVSLVVDEWGVWYDVEPGTNPGFLFQQNTMRDALVAGINLNIFNNHADRVKIANIAQMVNVLQAIIFTEGEKMVLTPTYFVFEMYKVHQNAALVPLSFTSPLYTLNGKSIPAITASASRNKAGKVHVSLTNADPHKEIELVIDLRGCQTKQVTGTVLAAKELSAHNTFDSPAAVQSAAFNGAKLDNGKLKVKLPAASVVMLEL
jgi:alpha-N-arabinofuranosidase